MRIRTSSAARFRSMQRPRDGGRGALVACSSSCLNPLVRAHNLARLGARPGRAPPSIIRTLDSLQRARLTRPSSTTSRPRFDYQKQKLVQPRPVRPLVRQHLWGLILRLVLARSGWRGSVRTRQRPAANGGGWRAYHLVVET